MILSHGHGAGPEIYVYDIEIYGNTHTKNINKLVILNNKILSILQNDVSRDTHTVELYTKFNTLPIPALHNCQIIIKISPQIYSPSW